MCVCVQHLGIGALRGQSDQISYSWRSGGCEPSDVGAGHSLRLLQEQHALLTAGSFLQLLKFIF